MRNIGDKVTVTFSGRSYVGEIVDMSGLNYVVELSLNGAPCAACGDRAQIGQRLVIRPELLRDD